VGALKALLAVLAIVLVAMFVVRQPDDEAAGSGGGEGTGSDRGGRLGARCTVFADAPALDRAGVVTATGRYRCDEADGGIDTTVYLQLGDGKGGWANIDRQPMAATGVDTTRKRAERDRTVRVTGPCTAGTYRTFVGGTVSTGDRGEQVEAVSKPVDLACPGPSPT
jgi:hypothetical protein